MGIINLSRTIGDLELKKYGLISKPNIFQKELDKEDKFVLMASDGVWDVISDTEVLELYSKNQNSEEYAENIVKIAVQKGSRDNISCLAIKL
jgi:protein phosphatase 1L